MTNLSEDVRAQSRPQPCAVISGGASGIGASTSQVFAERGWRVAVVDRDAAAARAIAADLAGGGHIALEVDVTSRDAVDAAVEEIAERFGRIDAVLPLAGIVRPSPSAAVTDDDMLLLYDIHVLGAVRLARAAYPHLRATRGAVAAISSMGAHLGLAGRLAYNAAKSAIEGVVRTLAVEWADDGVRVNAVAPAWVRTPAIDGLITSGYLDPDPVIGRTPMGRFAEPREIGEVFEFLASPRASYVTGAVLKADGGMTVQFPLPAAASDSPRETAPVSDLRGA